MPVAKQEFQALAPHGRGALIEAMKRYQVGDERPSEIKNIGGKLLELRVQVGSDPFRLLFFRDGDSRMLIIVHAFYKNQQKLPAKNLTKAKARMAEWQKIGRAERQA